MNAEGPNIACQFYDEFHAFILLEVELKHLDGALRCPVASKEQEHHCFRHFPHFAWRGPPGKLRHDNSDGG